MCVYIHTHTHIHIYIYIYIVQLYFNLQRLRRLVRRPHTTDLRVRCQVNLSGICGEQSGVGTGFPPSTYGLRGTRWRSWLRHCATSRKIAGSIPEVVNGPEVDSGSNRNEYQEYFLGVKAAGA